MTIDVWGALYKQLFAVLSAAPALTGLVPALNIRPADDPAEPAAGGLLIYNLEQHTWDERTRRGRGQLRITAGSPTNKDRARAAMLEAQRLLTPRAISGGGIVLHKLKQSTAGATTDLGQGPDGYWRTTTAYDVLVIEG